MQLPRIFWKNVKYELRHAYLALPFLFYIIMLNTYPFILEKLYGQKYINQCSGKNLLIKIDEFFFSFLYQLIDDSVNVLLLIIFAIPYLLHFINPPIYLCYLLLKRPGWIYFWKFGLALGLTSSLTILL